MMEVRGNRPRVSKTPVISSLSERSLQGEPLEVNLQGEPLGISYLLRSFEMTTFCQIVDLQFDIMQKMRYIGNTFELE